MMFAAIETLLRASGWQKHGHARRCWRHPDIRSADGMADSWVTALMATVDHERRSAELLETLTIAQVERESEEGERDA
jgi:hypothetical protein